LALQKRVAQFVTCIAGVATLFVLLGFLRSLPLTERSRGVAFAVVALNPKMIATSIQATNDAFVILFATIALAAGHRFFRNFSSRAFAVMTVATLLACVSKGNGLVIAVAIACTFVVALLRPPVSRHRILGFAALMLVAFVATVPALGGYWSRYQQGKNPFAVNQDPAPPPHFIQETFDKRPGITSIVKGYLTFRLADMLVNPEVDMADGSGAYPLHRTSFWSLLYGGAHSFHYEYDPENWRSRNPVVLWLLRAIWVLALIPTAMLAIGLLRGIRQVVNAAFGFVSGIKWNAEFLLAVTALGYIGFAMAYGYRYRDYATMKPIFLYPAMVPFIGYYAGELERVTSRGRRLMGKLAYGSATLLVAAYTTEAAILMGTLFLQRLHRI